MEKINLDFITVVVIEKKDLTPVVTHKKINF